MAVNLQSVADLLSASLDPRQNKQGECSCAFSSAAFANFDAAEQSLKAEESKPGFSLALLQIAADDTFPLQTRLASSLFFKNFVRRNWTVCERLDSMWRKANGHS